MRDRVSILLRHGDYHQLRDTPSAHQPFPLNQAGRLQAAEAIDLIKEMVRRNGWRLNAVVHCSALLRAWQTADIVLDGLTRCDRLVQTDRLAERSVGSAANLSMKQINEVIQDDPRYDPLFGEWKTDSHFALPFVGAESLIAAGERVADYITETINEATAESVPEAILFVGHGGAFRHAAHQLGVLPLDMIGQLSMDHATPVALAMSPSGQWSHVDGEWKVRSRVERSFD